MSWVRIWVHVVFTTKKRAPLLSNKIRHSVFNHIKENALDKGLHIKEINGYHDHVHILLSLNREVSLSKSMQLIKGESSFWINKNKIIPEKFSWQDDYWAVGVSESHVKSVVKYIQNQETHHDKKSFKKEIDEFMSKYDWQFIENKNKD